MTMHATPEALAAAQRLKSRKFTLTELITRERAWLDDLSNHVAGRNRDDLLSAAAGHQMAAERYLAEAQGANDTLWREMMIWLAGRSVFTAKAYRARAQEVAA